MAIVLRAVDAQIFKDRTQGSKAGSGDGSAKRALWLLMRSHSVFYARQAALPDWLFAFQHELGSKTFDGRDDLLMLSALLDEVDTVVAGVQRGHGTLRPEHWRSLLAEFDHASGAFGPAVAVLVAGAVAPLDNVINPDSPPAAEDVSAFEGAIGRTRVALCDPSVRLAAWDDALDE